MNPPAVNLGAGGFVSYYENGGAAVPPSPYVAPEEPVDAERGIGAYIADTLYRPSPSEGEEATPIPYLDLGSSQTAIRKSGRTGTENRETYYPDSAPSIMDKRNNAVGVSLFNQAGIKATPAQLTATVDGRIFEQLNIILGRKPEERGSPADRPQWKHNFRSPPTGPDVYFPRGNSGHFLPD